MQIKSKLILENETDKGVMHLPCIPALRPGMVVHSDFRFRIDGVIFQGDTVQVKYTWL